MADFSDSGGLWSARTIGAISGAAISLAYLFPAGRREAAMRFFTGVASGLIFGGPMGLWIAERLAISDRLASTDMMLAGSAAASLSAWWGLGVVARLAARLGDKGG